MKKNEQEEGRFDFAFLSDLPLQSERDFAESKFGHQEIAAALRQIATTCPAPFTIGLFGKWGAGKSSIANRLQADLQTDGIPVIIFDVWKHQGDALRRTFLRESLLQLKAQGTNVIEPDYQLDERLDKNVQSTVSRPSVDIPWRTIRWVVVGVLLALAVALYVDRQYYELRYSKQLWQWAITGVGVAGLAAVAALAVKATKAAFDMIDFTLSNFVGSKAVTYTVDKFLDPRDFEQEFERLLQATKPNRVVVVFDNLDRVFHEKSIEVLSTVKTFLEPADVQVTNKEVVFVIPCDAEAIREHIRAMYATNGRAFSPDEFLRKFFSAVLWIPDFIPAELEGYTRSMLKATKVVDLDNDKVAWIITKAYRENPRQIKQFINILLANYLLVRQRQGADKDFPDDFLATQTPQLARFLLLSERFPVQMSLVRDSRASSIEQALAESKDLKGDEARAFRDFVRETSIDAPISDARLYFTLRRSEHEKVFPGIEDFFSSLEDRKVDAAIGYLEQIEDFNERREEFSQVVKQRLQGTPNELSSANAMSTLLAALDKLGLTLTDTGYGEIFARLCASDSYFVLASPSVLARQIAKQFPTYRPGIVDRWVKVLQGTQEESAPKVSAGYLKSLLRVVCGYPDWFTPHEAAVQGALADRFASEPWALQIVNAKPAAQKAFVTPQFAKSLIESLSGQDVENASLSEKATGLLGIPREDIDDESYRSLLAKVQELAAYENGFALDAERQQKKESLLANLQILLVEFEPGFKNVADEGLRNEVVARLVEGANAVPDVEARGMFIPALMAAESLATDPQLGQAHEAVAGFFRSASLDSIEAALDGLPGATQLVSESTYADVFEDRARHDTAHFDKFYPLASDDRKTRWLKAVLDQDPTRFLELLEARSFEVPGSGELVAALLDIVESRVAGGDGPMLRAVSRMRCADDQAQQSRFAAVVQRNLTSTDAMVQEVGLEALSEGGCLGEQPRREIAKAVFDWIRGAGLSDKYQRHSILAVVRERDLLNAEEIKELLQFLFEELVRKGTDTGRIDFGFEELTLLKPTYADRRTNFDDIRSRIEAEQDEGLRAALVRGLKSLKPPKSSQRNRDFWDWVDGLS